MTGRFIASVQLPSGAIPWEPSRELDPWNHVEAAMGLDVAGLHDEAAAAYDWLARNQNPDGSWYAAYRDNQPTDTSCDSNFTAYVAVGVRHHQLSAGADVERLVPMVAGAVDFVLARQRPGGEIGWRANDDGALLTGNCSIHHALRCAADLGILRAGAMARLRAAIREERAFTVKPHSMDWYYPVLTGVLEEPQALQRLRSRWHDFVVPGLGVRCVDDQPWVTGGETAELALALAVRGQREAAQQLLTDIQRLRHHDGSYWTGYQFENDVLWPDERTTWTAGAVLLASAAIAGEPATLATFSP